MKATEDVRTMLSRAFADVECPYPDCDFEPQYWLDMREHMFGLTQRELHWMLPRMLISLIDDPEKTNWDSVLDFLDLNCVPDESRVDRLRCEYGEEIATRNLEFSVELRQSLQGLYSGYTTEQACAIGEWLKLVRSWPDYVFFDFSVESAISYWEKRCGNVQGR